MVYKKIRKDKEDEYYKSLCKTTLVNGILSNNAKFALATELQDREKELRAQFRNSVKVIFNLLNFRFVYEKEKVCCV